MENKKPDCRDHPKLLLGEENMEVVANLIGDLHYEKLTQLLAHLGDKLDEDGKKDQEGGRPEIARYLLLTSQDILEARWKIERIWLISKRFMEEKPLTGTTPLESNSIENPTP